MTDEELQRHYLLCGFYHESALAALISRKAIPEENALKFKQEFYDSLKEEKARRERVDLNYKAVLWEYFALVEKGNEYVSLTAIAKLYSKESPGYVIQSWMRSHNTIDFLRQWEINTNPNFDDTACEELIMQARKTSLTLTPTQWVNKTKAVGLLVKQGKGGGVKAHPDIASDFHMWLNPSVRLALIRFMREHKSVAEKGNQ